MGLMDALSKIFSGSKNAQPVQVESFSDKREKINKIDDLRKKILAKTIVDNEVNWPLSDNILMGKSLAELDGIISKFEGKLKNLEKSEKRNANRNAAAREAKQEALYTGKLTPGMSSHDLDWSQRGD